jgi:hypothetical protein
LAALVQTAQEVEPVQAALRAGAFPWYDPQADKVRPVWPAQSGWQLPWGERFARAWRWVGTQLDRVARAIGRFFRWLLPRRLGVPAVSGEMFMAALLFAALAVLLVLLLRLGLRGGFFARDRVQGSAAPGTIARLADLPEDFWRGLADPWGEALLRRARGDLAGAVVFLFAYQLLVLSQVGLLRLMPGRTGRQYVSTLQDPLIQGSAAATLRLFEEVYYGHKQPEVDSFEQVWSRAEAFRDTLLRSMT